MNKSLHGNTTAEDIKRQLKIDAALIQCIQTLHSNEDVNDAINELLCVIADFHAAERAYIFEIDDDDIMIHNTYEWCREGVTPQIEALADVPLSVIDRWIVYFEEQGEFYINSIDGELSKDSEEYRILAQQDIESLMAAPLYSDGRLVGFLGVDNPRENTDTLLLLQSVSAFVVNDIQKRVTMEQRIIGAIANIYISMFFINIQEDSQTELQSNEVIRRYMNQSDHAEEQLFRLIRGLAEETYVEGLLAFSDFSTLNQRMQDTDIISHEFLAGDGHWCRVNFIAVNRDENRQLVHVINAMQFIDKEKQRELEYQRALKIALENQNEMYTEMLQIQSNGLVVVDKESEEVLMINEAALHMFGYQCREDFDGHLSTLLDKIISENKDSFISKFKELHTIGEQLISEYAVENGNGGIYILSYTKLAKLSNGQLIRLNSLTDVTEKKKMEHELLVMSQMDALTGIYNRRSGEEQIEALMKANITGMFCLFDVDKFKSINDSFGHAVGDRALTAIADCLRDNFNSGDVVLRLGGDEFAAYAVGIENEKEGAEKIEKFFAEVEQIQIPEMMGQGICVSLGAVFYKRNSGKQFDELYQMADAAMYICKNNKGNHYVFYQG